MNLETVLKGLRTTVDVIDAYREMQDFQTILKWERPAATQYLSNIVQRLTPEQLDQFELAFLKNAGALFDVEQRVRAMELYAWLKIAELGQYQTFRGFCTRGESL